MKFFVSTPITPPRQLTWWQFQRLLAARPLIGGRRFQFHLTISLPVLQEVTR